MRLGHLVNTALERSTGRRFMRPPRRSALTWRRLDPSQVYGALAELRRRARETRDPAAPIDLRTAELRVFSQNGEDGILAELVNGLPVTNHTFVEFGVEDGIECNTRVLAEVFGWSGVYLEPDVSHYRALARRWEGSPEVTVVNEAVTPERIGDLFQRAGVPHDLGVLSIDIDGQDYWVWAAMPDAYRPAVVVVECNTGVPRGVSLVERRGLPWNPDHSDSFGASVEALRRLGERRGYRLVHVDLAGVNAFFVRADLLVGREVVGITTRSANYGLVGAAHPPTPARPTVEP